MFNLSLKNKKLEEDRYELTRSVKLVDVKGYLQKEYDRANKREDFIKELEDRIEELNKIVLKYDAMLVIQEETQKRIEKQNHLIEELREKIKTKDNEIKLIKSKQIDIKINAENKLKAKDDEIKELKRKIKELSKIDKNKKEIKNSKIK